MVNDQHDDRANHRYENAVDIDSRDSRMAHCLEDFSSDNGADYSEDDVAKKPFTASVDDLAGKKSRNQPDYDPRDNSHHVLPCLLHLSSPHGGPHASSLVPFRHKMRSESVQHPGPSDRACANYFPIAACLRDCALPQCAAGLPPSVRQLADYRWIE